jgi:integrase
VISVADYHGFQACEANGANHRKFLSWPHAGILHPSRNREADGNRPEGGPVSELCDLHWHQVELTAGRLHVRRTKRGTPSVHPMQGDEIRALRRLQREQQPGPHVFATERGGPMAPKSFHTLMVRLGERAKMRLDDTSLPLSGAALWRRKAFTL